MTYHCTVLFNQQRDRFEANVADVQAVHTQTVEATSPEGAAEQMWLHCQNIDSSWCEPPRRSMAVGDFVAVRDQAGTVNLCHALSMGFHVVALFEGMS